MMISPTRSLDVRGPDSWARSGGAFGASRDHSRIGKPNDTHKGSDLEIDAWAPVVAPATGEYHRTGIVYPGEFRYHKAVLWLDNGLKMNILYLWPNLKKGDRFIAGQVIGVAEDLSALYDEITNHLHVELVKRGCRVDPIPYLRAA